MAEFDWKLWGGYSYKFLRETTCVFRREQYIALGEVSAFGPIWLNWSD